MISEGFCFSFRYQLLAVTSLASVLLQGYRTSTEKFIYHAYLNRPSSEGARPPDLSALREVALSVFEECASELREVNYGAAFVTDHRDLDEILRRLELSLSSSEPPAKDVFEELRGMVSVATAACILSSEF